MFKYKVLVFAMVVIAFSPLSLAFVFNSSQNNSSFTPSQANPKIFSNNLPIEPINLAADQLPLPTERIKLEEVGSFVTGDGARDIEVVGNYAYIADEAKGLQIVDISKPASPRLAGAYNTEKSASDVYVVGNLLYLTNGKPGLNILRSSFYFPAK